MESIRQKKQQKVVKKCVSSATVLTDLLPFLHHIDLNTIKSFIIDQLCNTTQFENIYSCFPLIDTLHENVIQQILSFTNNSTSSMVCKTFNTLCNKNKIKIQKQFLIENKFESYDIDEAYQLTINLICIGERQKQAKKSIKHLEKQINLLRAFLKKLEKDKWCSYRQMSDIHKPAKYLSNINCNINVNDELENTENRHFELHNLIARQNINLPLFPTKYVSGYNNEFIVYPEEYWTGYDDITLLKGKQYAKKLGTNFMRILRSKDEYGTKSGDKIILTPGIYNVSGVCGEFIPEESLYTIENKMDVYLIGKNNFSFKCDFDASFDPKLCNSYFSDHYYYNSDINNINGDEDSSYVDTEFDGAVINANCLYQRTERKHVFKIRQFSNVHFENITIDGSKCANYFNGTIIIKKNSGLWMENCIVNTNRIGIVVSEKARCYVKNCTFIGGSTGIKIDTMTSEVLITDCTFTNCGNETQYDKRGDSGAIVIASGKEPDPNKHNGYRYLFGDWTRRSDDGASSDAERVSLLDVYSSEKMMRRKRKRKQKQKHNCEATVSAASSSIDIRIINNTFVNNYNVPIRFQQYNKKATDDKTEEVLAHVLNKCQIAKNQLWGFNGINVDTIQQQKEQNSLFDPNVMYHQIHTQLSNVSCLE